MRVIPFLAWALIRTLFATLRVRHVRPENIERTPQYVLAFWHAHLMMMLHCRYRAPISVMISQSKDGEYIASMMRFYGAVPARGSTTRGGAMALRELLRHAREGMNLAFTPDGPRGPARIVQPGVITAAQLTGLPIVPAVFAAKKKSSCAPGTAWSSRCRSRRRSSCMVSRSSCRATATSSSGA